MQSGSPSRECHFSKARKDLREKGGPIDQVNNQPVTERQTLAAASAERFPKLKNERCRSHREFTRCTKAPGLNRELSAVRTRLDQVVRSPRLPEVFSHRCGLAFLFSAGLVCLTLPSASYEMPLVSRLGAVRHLHGAPR